MKNSEIKWTKTYCILVLILVLSSTAHLYAQPEFNDEVEDGIPLDGGLSLLIAGAAAYGIHKLRGGKTPKET